MDESSRLSVAGSHVYLKTAAIDTALTLEEYVTTLSPTWRIITTGCPWWNEIR